LNRKKPNILNYKLIKFYQLKLQQLIIDAKSFSAKQTIKLQSSIITTLKEAFFCIFNYQKCQLQYQKYFR